MNKERLSQLLDGELQEAEMETALTALLTSPEQQKSWESMNNLRAVMNEDLGLESDYSLNITDKVSAMLENEPVIMAPGNITSALPSELLEDAESSSNVVSLGGGKSKTMAYLAMAASVAVIALFAYSPGQQSAPTIASSNTSATATEVSLEQELQSMMVQHGEFSGAAALNGLVSYAKVVNNSQVTTN